MRFEHELTLPYPRDQVFAWHERPGALVRLTPPSLARVVQEPTEGIRDGSVAVLRLAIPGTVGAAGLRCTAQHSGYDPPAKFEDSMIGGPMKAWHHTHRFIDAPANGTMIRDEVDFELPAPAIGPAAKIGERVALQQLSRMWAFRDRQLAFDLDFHSRHTTPKTVAVTGATGMVGTQLVAFLRGGGHDVHRVVRTEARGGDIAWDPARGILDAEQLRDVDVVIHLAGAPIGRRFTDKHKKAVRDSRIDGTRLIADTLATLADDGRRRALISASASGYYGANPGDEVLAEDRAPGDGFLADLCRDWEAACQPARDAGVRVVNVRTGIVQSAAGGQLGIQAPLFRLGAGGPLGSGDQWMPWIALEDVVGIYAHAAMHEDLEGPINAVAPGIVRNAEYADALAHVLHRPAFLKVPRIGPAMLFGADGADEFVMAGQRMSAEKIETAGYRFGYPELIDALGHTLAR
ncbi:TIGR01777 family oxidoreductase [Cumulibacter soli]|uniref:TIGR01777 family oxidoreductase n=1 Tax=Cumulibacter soli TaxID=2546344 RepID=UPI0010671D85|nr:TIGR01777 family oxidoreductase [Cumulibacter soli]